MRNSLIYINFLLLFTFNCCLGQSPEDGPQINHLKTAVWELGDLKLLYPVLQLGSPQTISLHFDDFHPDLPSYAYRMILCDKSWNPETDLLDFEYMENELYAELWDYQFSSGTFEQYSHYTIELPNDQIAPKVSGNYLLQVFLADDPDSVVLQKRVYVLDKNCDIQGSYQPSVKAKYAFSHQELQLEVILKEGLSGVDPYREISVTLMQNGRLDHAFYDIQPAFVMDKTLRFGTDRDLMFPGGKEFREFDISTLQFPTGRVHSIETRNSINRVYLQPDEPSAFKSYMSKIDVNGRYVPLLKDREEMHFESDYAHVKFSLVAPYQPEARIFIFGQLSDWTVKPEMEMQYDPDSESYQGTAFVKQGFYNYQYIALDNETGRLRNDIIEGNSEETENDYVAFVYYRPLNGRYDQLIGFRVIEE